MASLDFVRDLTEKIKSQDIQYMLLTLQKEKDSGFLRIMEDWLDDETIPAAIESLEYLICTLKDRQASGKFKNKKKKKNG